MLNPWAAAQLSVVASGTAPITYQWRRNGTAIAGGTKLEMTNVELEKMNYLVEGVVGSIPA